MLHVLYSLMTTMLSQSNITPDPKPLNHRTHLHGHMYFELSFDVSMSSCVLGFYYTRKLFFSQIRILYKYAKKNLLVLDSLEDLTSIY